MVDFSLELTSTRGLCLLSYRGGQLRFFEDLTQDFDDLAQNFDNFTQFSVKIDDLRVFLRYF